jgi:NRAMP (natural resistance-associated macrophage protein)-like metal ion transporter
MSTTEGDKERLDLTSRWVEEDALAVVGGDLSDDDAEGRSDSSSAHEVVLPLLQEEPPSSSNSLGEREQVLPLYEGFGRRDRATSWQQFLMHVGPGFLMCIAYIDPGNLGADLVTGAMTGYRLLWVLLYSTLLGGLLQSLAAKLGVSTSRHLAQHCRDMYPGTMRYVLWLMAEIAIIGSDVQEVIGTSLAVMLLTGGAITLWQGVLVGAVAAYALLFLEKFGVRWLESFFQVLVGLLALCMTIVFFVAKVPYLSVLDGLAVPRLDATSLSTATGLLGAVIMPHNLFLHSALVHERGLPPSYRSTAKRSLMYYKIEAFLALLVTLVINISVISVFARGFYGQGSEVPAASIGLANAGTYLAEKFGPAMGVVWALGLLSAGMSSTMTGTYAGQFVMSGFLELRIGALKRAALTRAVALVPTLAVALAFDQTTSGGSSSLDTLNQWLNILQSVQLPFAIIPLLFLTANPGVVGLGFANSMTTNVVSGVTSAVIIGINIWMAAQTVVTRLDEASRWMRATIWVGMVLYVGVLVYLVVLSIRSLGVVDVQTDERRGFSENDDAGEGDDDENGGRPEEVSTAGRFVYVPPIPLVASPAIGREQDQQSVASSRAASLVLSSRTGITSHIVID